jgi:hypothetical protein
VSETYARVAQRGLIDRPDGAVLRRRDDLSVWVMGPDVIEGLRRLRCVWAPSRLVLGDSYTSADIRRLVAKDWEVLGSVPGTPAAA